MASKTDQTQILSVTGVANGASATSSIYNVSTAIASEIEVLVSTSSAPDPNQGANVVIEAYASQDGTNVSAVPFYSTTIYPDTTSYRVVLELPDADILSMKYYQIKVTNNLVDSGGSGLSADFTVNAIQTTW